MTADPDEPIAHTDTVGNMTEKLNNYLVVLANEIEAAEDVRDELADLPNDEALTVDEYHDIFPSSMPLEEWEGME